MRAGDGVVSMEHVVLVLHHSRAQATDKLVLIGIANQDGQGGSWPSVAMLARFANVKERAVQYSISRLVTLGELEVVRNAGGTRDNPDNRRPNLYRVLVRCPEACDGTWQHRVHSVAPVGDLGVQRSASRGAVQRASEVQPSAPKPSLEPSMNQTLCAPPPATLARATEFEAFWTAYPRHTDKAAARKAWGKLIRDRALPELDRILAAVAGYRLTDEVQRGVTCHPSTWLNRRRWEDDLPDAGQIAVLQGPPPCPSCGVYYRDSLSCLTPAGCPMLEAVAGG